MKVDAQTHSAQALSNSSHGTHLQSCIFRKASHACDSCPQAAYNAPLMYLLALLVQLKAVAGISGAAAVTEYLPWVQPIHFATPPQTALCSKA